MDEFREQLPVALALWLVVPVAGCSSNYKASRIEDPRSDLVTARTADGPDGDNHRLTGRASWYGSDFHGQVTASGERYDMYGFTAAHKSLPFHTIVRVVHPRTRKSVVVRINDRGPYVEGRVIDLSWAAARDLGLARKGTMRVKLKVLEWGDGTRIQQGD